MIEDFWKDKYPAGIAAEINPDEYPNIQAVLKQSCQRFANKPAFSNLGKTITYGELYELSGAFAAYLQQHTDLKPGDRIAVQLPNVLQYPVAVFGAIRAGLIVFEPDLDGMAWLHAYLPTPKAKAIFDRLTTMATSAQGDGEPRTLTQLRVDVAAALLLEGIVLDDMEIVPMKTRSTTGKKTRGTTARPHETAGQERCTEVGHPTHRHRHRSRDDTPRPQRRTRLPRGLRTHRPRHRPRTHRPRPDLPPSPHRPRHRRLPVDE